jgi:hypothetical protein
MPDVEISLGLSAKELYQELQSVTAKFVQFAGQTTQAGEKAGEGFAGGVKRGVGGVSSSLSGVGSQLTGLLAGYLGFSEFQKVVDKADEIHRTSQRFGLDAEQLQVLANVGKTTGLSMEEVARAMTLITINAQKGLDPASKQAIAMEQLHISTQQFAKLNAQDSILRLADAYKDSAQDGAAFAAVSDLIGRRNTAMIPLLQLGSKAILDQAKDFHTMGDAEVTELHRIKVEEDRYLTNLDSFVGTAISGWGRLFGFIKAAASGINVSTVGGITYDKDASSKAMQAYESQLYQDTLPPEKRGITPEKKIPTATAQEIKKENEDEKSGKKDQRGAERDAERDAEKVRKIERERELESLPYEQRHTELQSQAKFLKSGADSAPDEAQRNEIKLQYYDIVKQIEAEEKEHAKEMERADKERTREAEKAAKESEKAANEAEKEADRRAKLSPAERLHEATLDAQKRDEDDRRAHGSYTGPGGGIHSGLVTGHVQSSGGLKTGSLADALSDDDFHKQFKPKGLGLGSSDEFHKQFQPIGLSRSDEVKRAAIGKDADKPGGSAADKLSDSAAKLTAAAKEIHDALRI